jgi:hypothetical protein
MATLDDLEQRLLRLEERDRADVMKRLQEIDAKVSKMKGESLWRFIVQVILAPLIIVAVGLIVNWQVERNKAENDRIAAAREMIPLLFDDSPDKAFATEKLLARIIDPEIADDLHEIVARHYVLVIQTSLATGDTATAARVLAAAENSGGAAADVVVDSLRRDVKSYAKIQKYADRSAVAGAKEREGFDNMLAGKFDAAILAFGEAEAVYPSYHSVYEIGRLLQNRRNDLSDAAGRKEVFQRIADLYLVPSDIRRKLIDRSTEGLQHIEPPVPGSSRMPNR